MGRPAKKETPVLYIRSLPKGLKTKLMKSAAGRKVSLNTYVIEVLLSHEEGLESAPRVRQSK